MKIFSAAQIKKWDSFTIKNESITSIDLMEGAAKACSDWIIKKFDRTISFKIFCGKGNNGGDGLAVARILIQNDFPVSIYIVERESDDSDDFKINLERLKEISSEIHFLDSASQFPKIKQDEIIIDALFGTGLNKKPSDNFESLILHLNKSAAKIISIDIPSGLYTDKSSAGNAIIHSSYTLTFQQTKRSFLTAENEPCFGEVVILDIGLSKEYAKNEESGFELIDGNMIKEIYVPRNAFANKSNYGYACLLAGSYGMMGAAVLSAKAALAGGLGKLTCYICETGISIMQTAFPEAMCKVYGNKFIKDVDDFKAFDAVGIGPGIGKHLSHKQLLQNLFRNFNRPVIIDADALNVLSEYPSMYKLIPENSIITPHPKEFERLFGKTKNEFKRINLALRKARELRIFIVLKGHHTLIATPGGKGYFNSTGNAGMATAGSGDVLTGILTGMLAQKYMPLNTCILGVYLHGLAGDIAANKTSKESMIANDIIDNLGNAFKQIGSK